MGLIIFNLSCLCWHCSTLGYWNLQQWLIYFDHLPCLHYQDFEILAYLAVWLFGHVFLLAACKSMVRKTRANILTFNYHCESLLNIWTVKCWRLYICDLILFCIRLYVRGCDLPLIFQIAFIPNEKINHTWRSLILELLHPCLYILERLVVCDIVNYQSSYGTSIITTCHGSVSFLTCRVPYLRLNGLVVFCIYSLSGELYTDCSLALQVELVSSKST